MRSVRRRASRRELDAEVSAGDVDQHSAAENAGHRKVELQLQLFAQVQGRASATAAEMIAARVTRGHLKNGRDRRHQRIERGERLCVVCNLSRCQMATKKRFEPFDPFERFVIFVLVKNGCPSIGTIDPIRKP